MGDYMTGYREKVTDEQLVNLVSTGVANSVGDFLNSSELANDRLQSTYEYAGLPAGHLSPNGVSKIVSSDTTETVEAYLAIISELMFNNNRLAKFKSWSASPAAIAAANDASDMVNYTIFKKNNGWELMNTWVKSALLWKNSIIRWDFVEDMSVSFEEYDSLTEEALDLKLSDKDIEVVGELTFNPTTNTYEDVRLKRTYDMSRVKIENVPPENFLISRDASSIETAGFVGIQVEMSRSDIRKMYPDIADKMEDWSVLPTTSEDHTVYSHDVAVRKRVTGQSHWQGMTDSDDALEANRNVAVTECWMKVDRDGDGIAELKHFIVAGDLILHEDDCSDVPLASLSPFEIPYEFFGLSVADMTRSTTLTSTAILRGFVENTYLSNYSPKLADPNVVDFSALQNLRPKQIIPTNGNPQGAVADLPPSTISAGTVPLLQHLQVQKEQATGMSKAAQGLSDELYVSGNSEMKLSQVMNASQKRIQHIARKFAEGGFKRLCDGVFKTIRDNMDEITIMSDRRGEILDVDLKNLPECIELEVDVNLGENSNANKRDKLMLVASQLVPMLKEAGAGSLIKPDAIATIAFDLLNTLDLKPENYLRDHTTEEFLEESKGQQKKVAEEEEKLKGIQNRVEEAKAKQSEANSVYTKVQADNALQDNIRQTAIALDRHDQEWAKLKTDAIKAEVPENHLPNPGNMDEMMSKAIQIVTSIEAAPSGKEEESLDEMVKKLGIDPAQAVQILQQAMGGGGQ
jgi:hypothetical protein